MFDIGVCINSCFFHTISHVESLLPIDGGACWGVTLDVCHINNATIWWLRVVHANTIYLSREMLWILGCSNYRSDSGFCWSTWLCHALIDQMHIIVTSHTICSWSHTNRISSLSINFVNLFPIMIYTVIKVNVTLRRFGRTCAGIIGPNAAEKARSNHCSLIHYSFLMIVLPSPNSLKALRWRPSRRSKINSW